jgi:hypothetical protein
MQLGADDPAYIPHEAQGDDDPAKPAQYAAATSHRIAAGGGFSADDAEFHRRIGPYDRYRHHRPGDGQPKPERIRHSPARGASTLRAKNRSTQPLGRPRRGVSRTLVG